ncbi:MAG: ribonuclease HI [Gammaproteobacteria bacterium]
MSQPVEMFTDGACRGNPGPGGWGVLMRYGRHEKALSGFEAHTTNNKMELLAAIKGLKALKRPSKVRIYTDSQYLKRGITEWLPKWERSGWLTSHRAPVKNADLWRELAVACERHQVEWRWIRGHSGHVDNERVDILAKGAIEKQLMDHPEVAQKP